LAVGLLLVLAYWFSRRKPGCWIGLERFGLETFWNVSVSQGRNHGWRGIKV